MLTHLSRMLNEQDLGTVISQPLVSDKIELVVDHDRADEKRNSGGELENNQKIAEPAAFEPGRKLSLQYLDRLKARKIKSRVTAGEDAHDQYADTCRRGQPIPG